TDLAKITKKGSKPSKNEQEIVKSAQKPDPKTFSVHKSQITNPTAQDYNQMKNPEGFGAINRPFSLGEWSGQHWVIDPTIGTYNVKKIRRACPENITASEWDKYTEFWNDPRNIARAAQNRQNRAKSTVISRQGSQSLAGLRDEMRQTSTTQEYPSFIDTFFVAHTVNEEFLWDED
nr:hypothetical protein [Tanacetum cinerariifolium]